MSAKDAKAREMAIMGQAYQVIAEISLAADLLEHEDVQRALDYFSANEYRDDFLPFPSNRMSLSIGSTKGKRHEPKS